MADSWIPECTGWGRVPSEECRDHTLILTLHHSEQLLRRVSFMKRPLTSAFFWTTEDTLKFGRLIPVCDQPSWPKSLLLVDFLHWDGYHYIIYRNKNPLQILHFELVFPFWKKVLFMTCWRNCSGRHLEDKGMFIDVCQPQDMSLGSSHLYKHTFLFLHLSECGLGVFYIPFRPALTCSSLTLQGRVALDFSTFS